MYRSKCILDPARADNGSQGAGPTQPRPSPETSASAAKQPVTNATQLLDRLIKAGGDGTYDHPYQLDVLLDCLGIEEPAFDPLYANSWAEELIGKAITAGTTSIRDQCYDWERDLSRLIDEQTHCRVEKWMSGEEDFFGPLTRVARVRVRTLCETQYDEVLYFVYG